MWKFQVGTLIGYGNILTFVSENNFLTLMGPFHNVGLILSLSVRIISVIHRSISNHTNKYIRHLANYKAFHIDRTKFNV